MSSSTPAQRVAFLPAFFANIDPADIPTPRELENLQGRKIDIIQRAVISLEAIFHIRPKLDAGFSLCSRVLPWTLFIHNHREHLTGLDLTPEVEFYIDFVVFAGGFHDDPPAYALMSSMRGFRTLIGRAWALLPQLDNTHLLEVVLNDLSGFIVDSDSQTPANFEELVDGAGGTLDDLCRVIFRYIDTIVGRTGNIIPNSSVDYIRRLLSFIADADQYPRTENKWALVPLGPLSQALDFAGLAAPLLSAITCLTTTSTPETGIALDECFMLLRRAFNAPAGSLLLEEAMEFGLLRILITCATLNCATEVNNHLRYILWQVIPAGLVWEYVAKHLAESYYSALELVETDAFRNCAIYKEWEDFVIMAEDRLEFMDEFNSAEFVSFKACDNMACGEIDEREYFNRCSRCNAAYYCDDGCQKADWRQGGHRGVCHPFGHLSLTECMQPKIYTRQRLFLRALLHYDYTQNWSSIFVKQVNFMVENPTCSLFMTVFDYSKLPLQIEIHSATDSTMATILGHTGQEWSNSIARATKSAGRYQLHVMQVLDGMTGPRLFVVPLRTSSSKVHDLIRELSVKTAARSTESELMADLPSFGDVVEIH
ncbi:hypothetical protein B0H14DRAFT_3488561 [Mycena olivaceomarginata]|nr:hypothetical protein B0H14DRAFT_3488561 [Mycena olivaceomarginata]